MNAKGAWSMDQTPTPTANYLIRVPIGDWSGDGHGQCEWYTFRASKPVEACRIAYFQARDAHPSIDPATWCCEYQDSEVPSDVIEKLQVMGCPTIPARFDHRAMAELLAWYLCLGDPELRIELLEEPPMLPFCGFDEKGRHIDFFGYGMF